MEGVTGSRDTFDDGDQVPVAALDFLHNFLIPVNKRADPVTDPELNPLVTRNELDQIRRSAKRDYLLIHIPDVLGVDVVLLDSVTEQVEVVMHNGSV